MALLTGWGLESILRTSPGKKLFGLFLISEFTGISFYLLSFLRLLILISLWSGLIYGVGFASDYLGINLSSGSGMALLTLMYALFQPQVWVKKNTLLHDQGIYVEQQAFSSKRQWTSLAGIFLGFGLIVLAIPNFIGTCCSEIASVKANAHTLQTMIETYGVDNGGVYPHSLGALYQEAKQGDYWKEPRNPASQEAGPGKSFQEAGYPPMPGAVTYQPVFDKNNHITTYRIQAYDFNGKWVKEKEKIFTLSND